MRHRRPTIWPAVTEPDGTSIRDAVLIGPSFDQPRGTQYPSNASHVVSSIDWSHFVADTYPYSPATTSRAG